MIIKADERNLAVLSILAHALWPGHSRQELEAQLEPLLQSRDAALFLALKEDQPCGFAQCQLRRDYVEGTQSSPVGYLEGIFVSETYRRQGYARTLLQACEQWAREQGCCEFASDCPLENELSRLFHLKVGFSEAARIICFAKKL